MAKLALVVPDQHYPFEDEVCINVILKACKRLKPDYFINLGDALDFWQVSRFTKSPYRRDSIADDIERFCNDLDRFDDALPMKTKKIFIEGNHEHRVSRYIAELAPEVVDLVRPLEDICDFEKRGWEYYRYGEMCRIGDTLFMHGDLHGQNVSMAMIRKYGINTVHGHAHTAGIRWHQDADRQIFSMNCGHVSNPHKQPYLYGGVNNWTQGFGVVMFTDDLSVAWPTFVPIIDGEAKLPGYTLD